MPVTKSQIISELDLVIKERQTLFSELVANETISKVDARSRYDALIRAKEIVSQYYKRIEEDMKLTDELNKPEILQSMINKNPNVLTLIDTFKLKSI